MPTIAQLLKQRMTKRPSSKAKSVEPAVIKTENSLTKLDSLIYELEDDEKSNSEDENNSNISESEDDCEIQGSDELVVERDANGKIVKIASSLINETIQPLPKEMLPVPRYLVTATSSESNHKRKISFEDDPEAHNKKSSKKSFTNKSSLESSTSATSSLTGLSKTVQELVDSYIPASASEKKPFYCRICNFQGSSMEEFETHKQSDAHYQTTNRFKKALYCRMCKKEFTSPAQLTEHLQGKLHQEQMQRNRHCQHRHNKFK
jgi:hypothetical protein